MKVLLIASAGGHLQQLVWMAPWWRRHERLWVTFDAPEARAMLAGEAVRFAAHPTNRDPGNAVRNLALAWQVLRDDRPDLVVSTGAGVAVPFFVAARARAVPSVFVEVFDRVDGPSLTGRIVSRIADQVVAQRPEQLRFYPGAAMLGPVR